MLDTKPNNVRIAKNTIFLYGRMIFVLIISLYTTRIILRELGVSDYGIYNVVAGFVSMFSFLNSSLVGAIQRFYNFETAQRGENGLIQVYTSSIIIQSMLSIILFIALETFGLWYINNILVVESNRLFAANLLFQMSSLSLIINVLSIPYSAAIVSFERMDYYAIVGIIDIVLKVIIVLILPYIAFDRLIVYSILLVSITIVNYLMYYIYAKIHFKILLFAKPFNVPLIKDMLSFSSWNFIGTFSNVLYLQGINMLLNAFFGPLINAARGISAQISAAMQGFASNIVTAFRPQLINSYAISDYNRTKALMYQESKICFLLVALLIFPIIFEIEYILHIWLGNNTPEYTASFTVLILFQLLISTLNIPFSQVVHATGRMKLFQIITGGITCLNLPVAWLLLKLNYGPTIVYYSCIILGILSQIACIFILKRIFSYSIKEYLSIVILPCFITLILSTASIYVSHISFNNELTRLIAVALTDIFSFTIWGYIFALSNNEKDMVKSLTIKFINRKR